MDAKADNRAADRGTPHETRLFLLLPHGDVQALAHDRYVALTRGEACDPAWTGQRMILIDWYLRTAAGQSQAVVNETCSWLVFDDQGRLDLHAAHAIKDPPAPNETQWARVRALVFGSTGASLAAPTNGL